MREGRLLLPSPPSEGYQCAMTRPKTIFDCADEAIEGAAVARARAEIAAGQGISHDEVAERLQRLAAGESVPPPTAD